MGGQCCWRSFTGAGVGHFYMFAVRGLFLAFMCLYEETSTRSVLAHNHNTEREIAMNNVYNFPRLGSMSGLAQQADEAAVAAGDDPDFIDAEPVQPWPPVWPTIAPKQPGQLPAELAVLNDQLAHLPLHLADDIRTYGDYAHCPDLPFHGALDAPLMTATERTGIPEAVIAAHREGGAARFIASLSAMDLVTYARSIEREVRDGSEDAALPLLLALACDEIKRRDDARRDEEARAEWQEQQRLQLSLYRRMRDGSKHGGMSALPGAGAGRGE